MGGNVLRQLGMIELKEDSEKIRIEKVASEITPGF